MPLSVKVNGRELTLAQIVAICAIIGSLGGAGTFIYNHFAKAHEMAYEAAYRQKQDWTMRTDLLDIKINTNKLLEESSRLNPPNGISNAPHKRYLRSLLEEIATYESEKKSICDAKKEARKELNKLDIKVYPEPVVCVKSFDIYLINNPNGEAE